MAFSAEESQAMWRATWGTDPPTGDVGNEVLLENDFVRIWNLELEPGKTSPLHTHMTPYFSIIVEAARLRTAFPDGSISIDEDPVGSVIWFGLDDDRRTHTLENIGSTRCVARVVELRGTES